MTSDLVKAHHLCRKAAIYIRQSSPHQVLTNQESLRLQYALRQRAVNFGWDEGSVEVIDADLGQSGSSIINRTGFKDVIARVTLGEVGIILSYEVTRLARNCSDWYPLLDLCGYRQCLIADRDGVYDPGSANGRLLLGLKGTISEVELHTMRGRLSAGLLNKAERGELALLLPAGLERTNNNVVMKDPSLEVQGRIAMVFSLFLELGSVGKVVRSFRARGLTLPRRNRFGDIAWRAPTASMLSDVLKNPAYAGAFVYGRTRSRHATYPNGKLMTARCPMTEWKVVVKSRYPAFIDWDEFERIQAMLSDNYAEYRRNQTRGAPRDGAAALQGIVWCGCCGRKMAVQYKDSNRYVCNSAASHGGGSLCQHLPADPIDARVVAAFFAAVGPAELESWTRAREARKQANADLDRAEAQQIERLRYQCLLAERQYNRVDPDNRLIAAELERRWEMALRELRQAEDALAQHRAASAPPEHLTAEEREAFLTTGAQLPELWQRPDMPWAQKKALLRCLIDKVVLQRVVRDRITVRIVWKGGEVTELEVEPKVHTLSALSRGSEMEAQLLKWAREGVADAEIADRLTKDGHRSARCSYVPVTTVRVVRQRHRILRQATPKRIFRPTGWLTVTELADLLQVARCWIDRRIRNGTIAITRDFIDKRFLFPNTEETLAGMQELKAGKSHHIQIASRADE